MLSYFQREPGFYRKLIALTLPMIIQNLITNSLGLIDTFMVGTLGEAPLAGVTLANVPIFVVQLMLFGIQSGSSVLISQYHGKGDTDSINRVMGVSFFVAGGLTLAFSLLVTAVPTQFMGLFGNDAEVVDIAARYGRVVVWSYFFDGFVLVYNGTHRAMGESRRGMYILAVSMVVNTVLNWVLIYGKLGAPAMGVEGAALATLLARVLSFCIMLVWAARDRKFTIRPELLLRPGKEMTRRFLRVATPVMCNETLWSLGNSMFPTIMGHMAGSKEILAAYAIAGNITNMCCVGVFAISNAAAILVGQTIGAGESHRVYRLGGLLQTLACLFGLAAGLVFYGLLHLLIIPVLYPLFELSAGAASICTMMLTIVFLTMALRAFCITNIVGILRGGGDVRMATVIDILPLWVIVVPLAALCGLVWEMGILWVYLAMTLENVFKVFWGYSRYRSGLWIRDVTQALN